MIKHFVLVLAPDMKRLSFMSMYERNFVLRWVMSISAAEQLAKLERFEFALVHFDPDSEQAVRFCERLKRIQPHTRIIFFKSRGARFSPDSCADLVLDSSLTESELAARMQRYLKQTA